MRTIAIGKTGLEASGTALGLMRISRLEDREIRTLFETARNIGITAFDHADIYGGEPHLCESRFATALRLTPADRSDIIIQSKVGIRRGYYDFSREHIIEAVEGCLSALRTEYLDLLLLHRPDALMEPEEVASAFSALSSSGKVRSFGVSNHTPGQIELLKTAVEQPICVNQIQLSVAHAPSIAFGLSANIAGSTQSVERDGELLPYCRSNDITIQAWSPFKGTVENRMFLGDKEHHADLNEALDDLASSHGVTAAAIALAWIATHPADIQVVVGTTNAQRLKDAAAGDGLKLTRPEWYRLFVAAGYRLP